MQLTAPTLIVTAGLPFAHAAAQDAPVTVHLEHDDADSIINVGDTVTWTLSIAFTTEAGAAAGAMNATLLANNSLGTSSDFAYTTTFDDARFGFNGGTTGGASNGAGIDAIGFINSLFVAAPFGGGPATYNNPLVAGTFEFTAATRGDLIYEFITGPRPAPFVTIDISSFAQNFYELEDVAFEIDTLTIVPTPATTLPFVALGLGITHRRR